MTTNITLLIVTMLTTNVTTTDNAVHGEIITPCPYENATTNGQYEITVTFCDHYRNPHKKKGIVKPATQKTEVIVISRKRRLVGFDGTYKIDVELPPQPISTNVRCWKLQQEWKEEE